MSAHPEGKASASMMRPIEYKLLRALCAVGDGLQLVVPILGKAFP